MNTKVLPCNDGNHKQDELHGHGMRVHNHTRKKDGEYAYLYRCTVCGKERSAK